MEAVRECTEDFMFGRRLSALVEELIEEEVVGSAGPIAHEVYYSSSVGVAGQFIANARLDYSITTGTRIGT